jgi:predicted AlkP superfamily pyrophosphatase or phosphodiesterase
MSMNLLSGWRSEKEAQSFQPLPTVSEMAIDGGVAFETIAPSIYEKSGFTAATMRGARFHGIQSIAERFKQARLLLAKLEPRVVYLYIPELDQTAHSKGWQSPEWLNLLEEVDAQVANLVHSLPRNTGVILTSDHGIVDIPKSDHIYLDEFLSEADLLCVGGDTRGLYVYLKESSTTSETIEGLIRELGHSCYVVTPDNLIEAGYWAPSLNSAIVPDFVVLAKRRVALYHRAFAKRKSLEMVGHHGSISNEEMSIPLIAFGF